MHLNLTLVGGGNDGMKWELTVAKKWKNYLKYG